MGACEAVRGVRAVNRLMRVAKVEALPRLEVNGAADWVKLGPDDDIDWLRLVLLELAMLTVGLHEEIIWVLTKEDD